MNTSINAPLGTEQEEQNSVALSESYDFQTIGGVDSLYYFVESNREYEVFYCDLGIAIEAKKENFGGFIPEKTHYITLAEKEFVYYGKKEGFHFFGDGAGWLRIGFKDPNTNKGVKDIRVQLQAEGIYLLGLVPLLDYVNNTLLASISKPIYTVTRADINLFCQFNLSKVIDKEHIVTRKRRFFQLYGGKQGYETMYVGQPPFRLRIYDKREELRNSPKYEMMGLYFLDNNINPIKDLWNLEFECHREFLKTLQISTVDDLLKNVEVLFHKFMKMVRLIDISTASESDIKGNRLYRAPTHPLWDYLDQSYHFTAYPQSSQALERLTKKPQEYSANQFVKEFKALVNKAEDHRITLFHKDILDILHACRLWLTPKAEEQLKPHKPILLEIGEAKYLLTRNFTPVPILPLKIKLLSDRDIKQLSDALTKALHQELAKKSEDIGLIVKHTQQLNKEIERRRAGQKELELWQQ